MSAQTGSGTQSETAEDGVASPLALDDFGDRMGPMLVKELRQGMRAHRFVGPFLLIHVLAVIVVLAEVAGSGGVSAGPQSAMGFGFGDGLLMLSIAAVVGGLMPLTGFGALRPELDPGRNVELLLLANLTRWQIVLGKWLVQCSLAALILVSLLPYVIMRYFIGGVDLVGSLSYLGALAVINATLNALVIGASGYGNHLGRLVVVGIGGGSYWISSAMCLAALTEFGLLSSSLVWTMVAGVVLLLVPSALYIAYGLQIGRARLRLFENPIDPPASGLVIALMFFTPLLAGMFAMPTAGVGGVVFCLLALALALALDRGTGQAYAQP